MSLRCDKALANELLEAYKQMKDSFDESQQLLSMFPLNTGLDEALHWLALNHLA